MIYGRKPETGPIARIPLGRPLAMIRK